MGTTNNSRNEKYKNMTQQSTHQTHRVHLTSCSASELVKQVKESIQTSNRIVVAVASNALVNSVRDKLAKEIVKRSKKIAVIIFTTRSYQYYEDHGNPHQFDEDSAPWTYDAKIVKYDAPSSADKTVRKLQRYLQLSKNVFPNKKRDVINIVIMVGNVLNNDIRREELERNDAHVVFLNPSIDNFRNFHKRIRYINGKKVEYFEERPDGFRFPTILKDLDVSYISESQLVTDLIESSYEQYSSSINIQQSSHKTERCKNYTLIVSKLARKKYSGIFPVVFEIFNKTHLGKQGVLVGDGLGTQNSYNRICTTIKTIDAPVIASINHPHYDLMDNLAKQLDGDRHTAKDAIVLDRVRAIMSRVAVDQSVVFVCYRPLVPVLREIAELKTLVRMDADITPASYRRDLKDGKIDELKYPLFPLLHRCHKVAAKLEQSKPALTRYINRNKIVESYLEKLVVRLMVTVTISIQEGVDRSKPIPDFKFKNRIAVPPELDGQTCKKLVILCQHAFDHPDCNEEIQQGIFERYDKDIEELNGMDKEAGEDRLKT